MFLKLCGSAAAGTTILLRIQLTPNAKGAAQLSKDQMELLPQVMAVIANRLLKSPSNVRLQSLGAASEEALKLIWNGGHGLDELEKSASDRFQRGPFNLTTNDRFMIADLKKYLTCTNDPVGQHRADALYNESSSPTHEESQMPLPSNITGSDERGLFDAPPPISASDMSELRKHVINLSLGKFSRDGRFASSEESVAAIFDLHLKEWIKEQDGGPIRLLLYAHGGLTAEGWGLYTAAFQMRWWKEQGVYPIFFVWETGLLETLGQIFSSGQRRLPLDASRGMENDWVAEGADFLLEFSVRRLGGPRIWAGMKSSARLTFEKNGDGRLVLEHIKGLATGLDNPLEIHAVGHSAGSIFLSHALKTAAEMKLPKCESVHFLAPAITCELFEETLRPLVGGGANNTVNSLSIFTMSDEFERMDSTMKPYNKSLLYLILKALEPEVDTPILGLEKSLLKFPGLAKFFGVNGNSKNARASVVFSKTEGSVPNNSRSMSDSHGGFDNDSSTMESVLRRILKTEKQGVVKPFPEDSNLRSVARMMPMQSGSTVNVAMVTPVTPVAPAPSGNGKRAALCIGIDEYPGRNRLFGCVNDCNSWANLLASRRFDVRKLTNGQATRAAILSGIKELIDRSQPGDVIAIQYSGHGTSVTDINGDEAAGDTPGKDESLVPIDFEQGHLLLDDDLGEICKTIKSGVNVTFFMDCCNSGTNTRMFMSNKAPENSKARFMILPP
jgi:hypothetical protein